MMFWLPRGIEYLLRRNDPLCDLVGERLTEKFVRDALKNFAPFVLVPSGDRYVMVTNREVSVDAVESKLQSWHHYRLVRELQLLQPVQLLLVDDVRAVNKKCLITDLPRARRVLAQLRRDAAEQSFQPGLIFQSPFKKQDDV
jgi:hypothetical protein